ncbi:MAG: hypothetical protein AB7I48_12600 [Planctomycetaceae bacterium]
MTIRYTCHACGSKLNIKEELAGTQGKCPKCKMEFEVPSASPSGNTAADAAVPPREPQAGINPVKAGPPAKAKMPARTAAGGAARDADFDPVAFLMEDDTAASNRRAAPPLSDDEIPAALELDVSEDEPPRRRGRPRRRVNLEADDDLSFGSASVSAGAMLSGGASAGAARDLLTRTVEESRARAARIDENEPREPSAVIEIGRELLVRGLPGLLVIALLGGGLYYLANSVMGVSNHLPDLGYVSGTITLDGAPLAGAEIQFRPVATEFQVSDRKSIETRTSVGRTNEQGYYELQYMEGVEGAVVGEHRVSISKLDGPREVVPANFGPYSDERRQVESGSNTIDFSLTADRQR